MSIDKLDRSFAIVTPSYPPDLKRCELLVESLDRTAPHVPHYLIVDRCDRPAFSHLKGGSRYLIESEAILGNWILRVPGRGGFWVSLKTPPVRGWIMQQIKKIGAIKIIPERTLVFCDSDVAFFRRFARDDLLVNGKVGLLDFELDSEDIRQWTSVARRLLGLSSMSSGYRNHVGYMVCWNRETVKAMQDRIEASTGVNWQVALARTFRFSEYMIYGIFVREVLGYCAVDHAPLEVDLIRTNWGVASTINSAINSAFAEFGLRTLGVMIHSRYGVDPALYRYRLERLWATIA